ncbi:MAG: hypothetical protein CMN02_02970 [Roseibacillus sp.]|nr:hypothetical protein [Roseibacillus sp.]
MKELKDGIRSHVRIDFKGNVHKTFRGHHKAQRCENEVRILRALESRSCPYVPRLLEYYPEQHYIVTTNCGQPAPDISRPKSDILFADLESEYGVRHDDPEPRNVTYCQQLGRFCLIDFELATLLPEPTENRNRPRRLWKVSWSSRSEGGTMRESNDDAFLALEVGPQRTTKYDAHGEALLQPSHLVLAVSDGMGGGSAGELASRLVLSWVKRNSTELYETLQDADTDRTSNVLNRLMNEAHNGLNDLAATESSLKGMGATLTLVWLTPGELAFAHIGDSRLYLRRSGKTTQLTQDHSRAWAEWKRGGLTEYAYRAHPRRSALSDALGGGHNNILPQIECRSLQDGDRLLLCTDGIIDGLWEKGLAAELSSGGEAKECSFQILRRARESSSRDDATVIVADIAEL